jgi:precorrin-4/cobalt-precorrin-4 C11-methyltransferase
MTAGSTAKGTVYFIGAGPGDPDLITVRGRALIERCPVCLFAGSLVPRAVVACAPPEALVRNTASMTLDAIVELMAEASSSGRDVARVHSGDPSLYGATAEQMRRLDAREIPYEIVPGVSSFQAAAAALKIELTPAGKNQSVILTRAAGNTGAPPGESLDALAAHETGMALFLSAAQMPEVVAALTPHYGPDAPVIVAYRVSWPDQQFLHCTLSNVDERMAEAQITRTALIFIGPMLDDSPPAESHLYDANYSHLFRKGRDSPQRHESTKTEKSTTENAESSETGRK